MPLYTWTDKMCRVSITMTMKQASDCCNGDPSDNARKIVDMLKIQLDEIGETKVRAVLRDLGVDQKTLDEGDNLVRLVRVAAEDILALPSQFRI